MKTDDSFKQSLRAWQVREPMWPQFEEAVWRRIASAEARENWDWRERLRERVEGIFRRPALAAIYIAVLLFFGLTAGYRQARRQLASAESQWRTRYVQSVDPYLRALR